MKIIDEALEKIGNNSKLKKKNSYNFNDTEISMINSNKNNENISQFNDLNNNANNLNDSKFGNNSNYLMPFENKGITTKSKKFFKNNI